MRVLLVLFSLMFLLAGCDNAPEPAKAPAPSLGQAAGARMDREAFTETSTAGSAAAQETVRRLQANDPQLAVAVKSRFSQDPAYVASLAGSVILQSTSVQRSSASFASYRIVSIEIHALPDGRVRVWSDFTNASKDTRVPRIFCRFNESKEGEVPAWQTLPALAPGKRRLVSFESKDNNVSRVTVLIR